MVKKQSFLIFAILFSCFCYAFCGLEKQFIVCDPSKESLETGDCPVNSKCIEVAGMLVAICACKVNFSVNRNYSLLDQNNSQYCIERVEPSIKQPDQSTTIVTTETTTVLTSTTLMTQETTSGMQNNKEPNVYYNPIGIAVIVSLICVLTFALFRVIKANHHVEEWTQKKQIIIELKPNDSAQ